MARRLLCFVRVTLTCRIIKEDGFLYGHRSGAVKEVNGAAIRRAVSVERTRPQKKGVRASACCGDYHDSTAGCSLVEHKGCIVDMKVVQCVHGYRPSVNVSDVANEGHASSYIDGLALSHVQAT